MGEAPAARRFGGIAALYGARGLERFRRARVCVIGLGGVGSWVAEALARSGIGSLTLIDMDHVAVSNMNRQLVALESTLGKAKARVLEERILEINPAADVHAIEEFVTRDAHLDLLDSGYDMVVDCIDTFRDKAAIIARCRRSKVPVVTVGGTGGKTDPSALCIRDLSRTEKDALLSRVRKELRQQYGFPRNIKRRFSVPAVFSTEQVRQPPPDEGQACEDPGGVRHSHLYCGGLGSVTHVTATAGFYAVSKVLEKLSSSEPENG
ncbi:MAG: tRNA threonylcarbamoyladenosine dehydratase [Gammaproteobacteria bacterium]